MKVKCPNRRAFLKELGNLEKKTIIEYVRLKKGHMTMLTPHPHFKIFISLRGRGLIVYNIYPSVTIYDHWGPGEGGKEGERRS